MEGAKSFLFYRSINAHIKDYEARHIMFMEHPSFGVTYCDTLGLHLQGTQDLRNSSFMNMYTDHCMVHLLEIIIDGTPKAQHRWSSSWEP